MSIHINELKVRAELISRRGTWKEIAERSGVSYSWISKFANGHIPNPGMRTLNRIHDGLRQVRRPTKDTAHA